MPDGPAGRWPHIERLFHEAIELDPGERDAFLDAACGGDDGLRRELRSLLAFDAAADGFLKQPALVEAAREFARDSPVLVGRRISGYELTALVGAGGMGEVYRARDLRLGRDVALKVLDPAIAGDPEYRRRFEDEARSASVLNHPNIVTIYAVGEEADTIFITMELVDGQTLRQRLCEREMPTAEAVDVAVQLASAIAAAHASGIVHRDLKPENVMITPAGLVKVLDFGMAKRDSAHAVAREPFNGTIIRPGRTEFGTIVGTVGYMSPEQASGRSAGPASDQFALGAIFYEMVTGHRAFDRDSRMSTLTAIIDATPVPVHDLNPRVPEAFGRVITRCLSKDPDHRYADTRDLERELRRVHDDLTHGLTRRQWLAIGAGAVAAAATGVVTWAVWPPHTLAVLPFANTAKNDAVDYLCLGIAESLIRRIKHLPLSVKSFSLVSNFAGSSAGPREIGRQLSVEKLVTGDVTVNAGRLLITAELVDVPSEASLWKKSYDRQSADIFKLWDEIATAVVDDGLHLRLTREERRDLLSRPTDNVEAFDLFLQARPFQMANTEDDYLAARALLQKAVEKDQRFAEAWVALAGTYWTSVLDNYLAPAEAWPQVDRCLTQATSFDPRLPDLHFGRAIISFFSTWDWRAADREWQAAWSAPDRDVQPELLAVHALARWALGDSHGALQIIGRARSIDPLSPMLALHEASYLRDTNRYEEAAARCLSLIRTHPDLSAAYFSLAEVRRAQQRFEEAIEARRKGHDLRDDSDEELETALARAIGRDGYERLEATAVRRIELRTLERRARRAYVSPLDFARAHAQLGENGRAFEYMDEALADRAPGLVFLNVDRAWDRVRTDPAFRAAVKRVGLPSSNNS